MSLNKDEKILVLRHIMKRDKEEFGKFFYPHHLKLEVPEFHKELYRLLEDKNIKFLGAAAPRGHAKSTVFDLVDLSHEIVNGNIKFALLVSDTYSQAVLFLDALKSEFESNERLRSFYGDMTSKNWSESEIVVNGIMVKAVGAGMKVRGLKYKENRPDYILVDDLENDELVENRDRRLKLERWYNGALIPSMSKNGRVRYIGTILHYDSLLSKIIAPDKYLEYTKRIYKAINNDKALWSEHLNLEELEKIKNDYIAKGQTSLFYQEYQNDPVSGEHRKFKLEKFVYYVDADVLSREINNYVLIDRAYSKEMTADFTGIIVLSIDRENNWYVRLAERFKGTEKELIDRIFDLKGAFNPIKIGIEQKAFEYTIKPTLQDEMRKRNIFFVIEQLKDLGKSKNIRIEGLVPRFENKTIYLKPELYDLIDELVTFPMAIHDDLLDALAYGLTIGSPVGMGGVAKQHIPSFMRR